MYTLASRILSNIFFAYAKTLSVHFSLDLQECLHSETGKREQEWKYTVKLPTLFHCKQLACG